MNKKFCDYCKTTLQNEKIDNRKDFLKWAVKNHPDKGGALDKFEKVSKCNDTYFGLNPECLKLDGFNSPSRRRAGSSRTTRLRGANRQNSQDQKKSCGSNKIKNPKTGRCVLKTSPLGKKIMKSSRSSTRDINKTKKKCRNDQIINPKTGRCVLKRSTLGRKIMKDM